MKKKKKIVLYSTLKCNKQCLHCFANSMVCDSDSTNMYFPHDVLLKLVMKLKEHYSIILNGTEVLLHPEYLPICKIIGQDYIFSNGLVFESVDVDSIITSLRKNGITTIILSHHFQATKTLNGVPDWIIEKITKTLQKKGFCVKYNTTLTKSNFKYIEDNCEYAYKIGAKGIKFFELKKIGKANQLDNMLFLNRYELAECYSSVLKVRKKFSQQELDVRISADLSNIASNFICEYGVNLLTVTPNMQIYGCPFAISNCAPIGSITPDYDLLINTPVEHNGHKCIVNSLW